MVIILVIEQILKKVTKKGAHKCRTNKMNRREFKRDDDVRGDGVHDDVPSL